MKQVFIEEKSFDKIDFTQTPLSKGEYEYCNFIKCDFSKSDLSDIEFLECEFLGCNLSLVTLARTSLKEVKFKDCKMLGVNFGNCNEFGFAVYFDACILNHSLFSDTTAPIKKRVKFRQTVFKNSLLHEADFTECDLTAAIFDNCDLTRTIFERTILEKADFRSSFNYSIDPELNRIKKAKFSRSGIAGLLEKYDLEIDSID
ncbi:pentapeptide repeat-containing protein [Chamaesiphon sp. GL140_3_metabinner_50]|uniref:pentapeptide repeat-containing protein n=1 Tax=Chamaesiphon sp. GL140_3_metabinner_50 TaxID=2970812 RepID=UPI0025E3F6F3|nr:pentapeptide repeat-containing protein [Chamaesiphon sp. GL140_3_metabinner_50]